MKQVKTSPCAKDITLKIAKVVEFRFPPKPGEGTPTPSEDNLGPFDSDYNDNLLVSRPITPITMPIELLIPSLEKKVALKSLLDSGCTKCLISPNLVGKLWVCLRRLKNPISFCQLGGSVAGGIPATFTTEPMDLTMGHHSKTLTFIVVPGMEWSLVLGLTWLKKWNPQVDWR